jgi:hypothetical protein
MNTIYNQLKESPLLYLSGGSKELFHSNFLYWLGMNYRDSFQQLMTKMCCINAPWPEGWTIRREYRHMDLCITYKKETGITRKKKTVSEECAFIIVENKVKSLPDLIQLRRYEKVYEGQDDGCTYAVLSLIKDFPGQKFMNEDTRWQLHHYDELAKFIRECCPDDVILTEHRLYIHDYCQFVENLSKLAEGWIIEEQLSFLSPCENLHELRLNDIYEKVRYAQTAALLAERLKPILDNMDTDEERVVLGMSNIDVILRRREDADEILSFYGCPETKPLQQIFIGCGMSHAVGLLEAKIKVSDDCCLVVQVQGNRYCHGFECEGILKSTDRLSPDQLRFLNFEGNRLPGKEAKADSRLCRYNANFIYKSQKILPTHTIGDILNTMIADCQI